VTPALTCVVTSYRSPDWLRLCLAALAEDVGRSGAPVELIVAVVGDLDHQSREPAREAAAEGSFTRVRRLWQEHDGYGKCRLANKAAAGAAAPLLFYLDGDCLVSPGTVSSHLRLSGPRRYVAGSALRLGPRASSELDAAAVRAFRHASPLWIARQAAHGEVESKAHYPWLRPVGPLFRRTGSGGFNGGCSSLPRALLEEVNGWDEALAGYGFDDTDLGHRLQNAGAQPVAARVEALVVHLWHERPYRGEEEAYERKRQTVAATLHGTHTRAARGLLELGPQDAGEWEDLW
jgi:GT2 family glycosyltransferase